MTAKHTACFGVLAALFSTLTCHIGRLSLGLGQVASICAGVAFPLIGNRPQATDVCQIYQSWSWTQPTVGHTVGVGAAPAYTARFVARATYGGTE